ncbi:MAG: amino acid permease [Actinomycetota bacterium]|nr:amino acid permease [Actinomycetota bacterium]
MPSPPPSPNASAAREHPRTIGWGGTVALAMGGSNQSLFLIGAIILAQGSAAIPLLIVGLLLSWAATPGWIELVLMWPGRVGGIAATCAEAFRPYNPVLANLTGVCYWWGWVPTCGLTAILSAAALREWYLPGVSVPLLATGIVLIFTAVNLVGVRAAARVAKPLALASAALALLSGLLPVLAGNVDWQRASTFHLDLPFPGAFGAITSAMAGLYLIGFAAPAFEAATCHVGETIDPERNVPRAVYGSAAMASLYFVVLPVVWLGALGAGPIGGELMRTLGPTFAPLMGGAAKAAAIWFIVINMFHGTLQPLAGAARTLSQLSDDGLLPRMVGRRSRRDVPWVATVLTAGAAIVFLLSGDPVWVIAAANLCYLIGISMPSIAVLLLRRNEPERARPYRAPRGTIGLGVGAACVWLLATLLGFEQFGLPTVLASLVLAYAGSVFYAWRRFDDRRRAGAPRLVRSLHVKLTGAMVAVMALDGAGYLLAVSHVSGQRAELTTVLSDIFVAVGLLTIAVGLVLPGMIAHAAEQVTHAADRLARGTVADLSRAMTALGRGDLSGAHARPEEIPVDVRTRDELGQMADSYNVLQAEVGQAALALDAAREGLRATNAHLERNLAQQAAVARLGGRALEGLGLDELMDDIVATVCEVLDTEVGAIWRAEPGGAQASLRASHGLSDEGGRARISLAGRVPTLATGLPLVVEDWELEQRFDVPPLYRAAGLHAGVTVSIAGEAEPFGLLAAHTTAARVFSPEEIDFLTATANVLADAIQRVRAEERTRHRALHDPLTGLPNRVLCADRLGLSLAQSSRRQTWVGVLFLDLDHFKLVNDSYGHGHGDELLCSLGARLDDAMRAGDTVARFGGDEFVVICDALQGPEEALRIADRITELLAEPFTVSGARHFVGASIGVAVAHGTHRTPDELIGEADAAMYRAKESGRGRVELFDEPMRAQATARLRTENDLRHALEHDELRVHYQPIVDLADGRVTGVEALVRWQHPERGLVGPGEFIAVAEDTGQIVGVGEWVFQAVCTQAAAWRAVYGAGAPTVTVNLSACQLFKPDVVNRLATILDAADLPVGAIGAEITESALMEQSEASIAVLQRLKDLGMTLLLDDFGTGYSSLAYANRFPIDVLKIDRSFVSDLAKEDASTIVGAIINMARGLGVDVIAEGIETEQQADRLRSLGCERGQGYLFARPMPAGDIDALLDRSLPAVAAPDGR